MDPDETLAEARAIVQKAVSIYGGDKVYVRAVKCTNCPAGAFVCHRNQVSDEPEAICRSWWDAFADQNWRLRLAKATGIIQFVVPGEEGS